MPLYSAGMSLFYVLSISHAFFYRQYYTLREILLCARCLRNASYTPESTPISRFFVAIAHALIYGAPLWQRGLRFVYAARIADYLLVATEKFRRQRISFVVNDSP